MSAVHVEMNGQVGLRPSLLETKRPDPFPELDAEGMIAAGHAAMIDVSSALCVWYARHTRVAIGMSAEACQIWSFVPTTLNQGENEDHSLCLS